MQLEARVVMVTGARRIGRAVALAAAARGADIAVVYRSSRVEADDTVAAVQDCGRRALAVQADVSQPAACHEAVSRAETALGRIDALVSMASLYDQVAFDALTPEAWRRQIGVDLDGSFYMAQAVVPALRRQGGGRIVQVTDWIAASGRPRYRGYVPYYVAKAGVKALTEALALELASDRILVNAIAPGPIVPPPGCSDEEIAAVEHATPLGHWGGAEEIVKAALLLLETDFITGETIRVDGGRHLS